MKRRELRRLRRQAIRDGAKEMGVSRVEFARLLKAKDEDAMCILVETTEDACENLGIDWDSIDWDNFFAMVLKFIEALLLIFGKF